MAPAVLSMGEYMPDIDLFPVVVNGNNQAIFVPSDIKHGKFLHLVCRGKRNPQFRERGVIGFPYDVIPMVQWNLRIGVPPSKLDQPFPCNDVQTKTYYLNLR
jgi:hypothetical protein